MNPSVAVALPLLAVVVWLLARRRPTVAAVATDLANRPAAALTAATPAAGSSLSRSGATARAVTTAAAQLPQLQPGRTLPPTVRSERGRQQRLNALARQLVASPLQRVDAMQQLGQWGDRAVLPLLQRGLRDAHPEVVQAAASAMLRFRGRSAAAASVQRPIAPLRLPRNARPR